MTESANPRDGEWVVYEVLGKQVRVRKSDLARDAAAFRAEEGTVVEKLMRRFAHLPGVTLEDAEPLPDDLF